MIKFLYRHNKDYSRFNIIKQFTKDLKIKNDIYILLPFSKNQFFHNFFKRDRIINDFFISNYDTYVFDRKKITKKIQGLGGNIFKIGLILNFLNIY